MISLKTSKMIRLKLIISKTLSSLRLTSLEVFSAQFGTLTSKCFRNKTVKTKPLMQLPPKHGMATTHVRSSEVQTVTDLCTRSARSRRPTQLPLRTRSARSRRPTQLPTASAAFTGCRSKQRGLAQPKMFLYILARDATNYSTTYATCMNEQAHNRQRRDNVQRTQRRKRQRGTKRR